MGDVCLICIYLGPWLSILRRCLPTGSGLVVLAGLDWKRPLLGFILYTICTCIILSGWLWGGHAHAARTTNSNDNIVLSQRLFLLYIQGYMYITLFLHTCILTLSFFITSLKPKSKGKALYDNVYEQLNLEEREYFGLNFYDKSDNLVSTFFMYVIGTSS